MKDSLNFLEKKARASLTPTENLTVSECAQKYRWVSSGVSSLSGQWRNENSPYLVEIMDRFSDDDTRELIVMKAARMGLTEVINNVILWSVKIRPAQMLYVQQTVELGERYSKDILKPLIRDNPCLNEKMGDKNIEGEDQTISQKVFPGGNLTIIGAKSPSGFRMVAKKLNFIDDYDGCPSDVAGEGDPWDLMKRRSSTFWDRKNAAISSPTVEGISKIDKLWKNSDQRRFFLPCLKCSTLQWLKWKQLIWGTDFETHYECENCKHPIHEDQKFDWLQLGKWQSTARSYNIGYHISELYSTQTKWQDMVDTFIKAKKAGSEALKTFITTGLGEPWVEKGVRINHENLLLRRENYDERQLPPKVCVLVAGADVQDDRIEMEVLGFGLGYESWSIDYRVFEGDPGRSEIWKRVHEYLLRQWSHPAGVTLRISRTCIDSGGHNTDQVYKFCKPRSIIGVFAIKGGSHGDPAIAKRSKSNKLKCILYTLGVDKIKALHYSRLNILEPGEGYCHFPMRYGDEYFKGLTSEKCTIQKDKKGNDVSVWTKIRARNEPLDCRVYAIAACELGNFDFLKLYKRIKLQSRGKLTETVTKKEAMDHVEQKILEEIRGRRAEKVSEIINNSSKGIEKLISG